MVGGGGKPEVREGKKLKRRGYGKYRFLKMVIMEGRRIYRLRWMSVRLTAMWEDQDKEGGREGATKRGSCAQELTFYSVLRGKMNARL